MYRRLQHLVRGAPGAHINAHDLDDVYAFLTALRNVFGTAQGDCVVDFALVEIVNKTKNYVVGHLCWDADHDRLQFRPAVPDDTQPLPLPTQ